MFLSDDDLPAGAARDSASKKPNIGDRSKPRVPGQVRCGRAFANFDGQIIAKSWKVLLPVLGA